MKKKNIFQLFLSGVICLLCTTSCSVEPDFYSQVVPETFYSSQDAVWQRFNRPFTHWRWYIAHDSPRWLLQELGTDEFCLPTRGSDWYDGAVYQKFHHHEYTEDMTRVETGWTNFAMGVALAWDALEDLENVDFDALGFEEGTRESMLNQQRTLAASFYLDGLDFFGGVPLYTTTQSEVKGRSTDVETFNFIDSLLKIAVPNLPIKEELGGMETGSIHRAAGAALQARLYFNAKSYIGKEMFTEAAQICQDIIDGKYGQYALETDWTNIFGFDNERCPELIWSVPSQNAKTETDAMYWGMMVPYNYKNYLGGLEGSGSDNALGLVPSLDPTGKRYPYKLGGAYAKFNDKDIRKQPYVYEGNGKYRGESVESGMGLHRYARVCRRGDHGCRPDRSFCQGRKRSALSGCGFVTFDGCDGRRKLRGTCDETQSASDSGRVQAERRSGRTCDPFGRDLLYAGRMQDACR